MRTSAREALERCYGGLEHKPMESKTFYEI